VRLEIFAVRVIVIKRASSLMPASNINMCLRSGSGNLEQKHRSP